MIIIQEEIRNICPVQFIEENAGIVVRIKKKPKDLLFGIRIENGKWEPLRVFEFMEMDRELDLSVKYTEITRKYE